MRTGDDPAAGRFLINGERLIRVPFKLRGLRAAAARVRIARCKSPDSGRFQRRIGAPRPMKMGIYCFAVALWANAIKRAGNPSPKNGRAYCALSASPEAPCGPGIFARQISPDPCASICNALHCHALQMEKADGGASREDER